MMEVRYLKAAERDVHEVVAYLGERSPLTMERFSCEFADLLGKIARHPSFGFPVGPLYRKASMKTLPWSVVYRHDADRRIIWVVIVRHVMQQPTFGMKRRVPEDPES